MPAADVHGHQWCAAQLGKKDTCPVHGIIVRTSLHKCPGQISFTMPLVCASQAVNATVCCMSMNHYVSYYAAVCLLNALLLLLNMRSDVALDFTACPAVSSG